MNKNNIVEFKAGGNKGLFISGPYTTKPKECFFKDKESLKFALMCGYGRNGEVLSYIPIIIPKANYKIVGLSNQLEPEFAEKEIGIPYKDYIKILYEKDITVNYSDTSNFWLVVMLIN